MRQSQEGLQPGLLAPPIERDVLPALGTSDHRTDRDYQDVDELMIAPARLARILQPRKARCQALDHTARLRLPRTGNGQNGPQSTARPKLMREPWLPPEAEIPAEVQTQLVHAMLDKQYRALLDEPVGMLGDVSPRAASRSAKGRERIAAWLKHLENRSHHAGDRGDPMATYDFTWL